VEWSKPDFVEITLGMEVTAYVNTDAAVNTTAAPPARTPAADSESAAD
jgi:coenzyme PQQ precursor peptide PqqA